MQPPPPLSLNTPVQGYDGIRAASRGYVLHNMGPLQWLPVRTVPYGLRPALSGQSGMDLLSGLLPMMVPGLLFSTVHIAFQPTSFLQAWLIIQPPDDPPQEQKKKRKISWVGRSTLSRPRWRRLGDPAGGMAF